MAYTILMPCKTANHLIFLSIPTGNENNTSPRFSLGARQSRLKMDIAYNTEKYGPISSYFEGDFFLEKGYLSFSPSFSFTST